MGAPTYAFGNAEQMQRERLRTLETLFDPGTIAHLQACGVAPGWHCLEVGAGGGSIAHWLADRVGPDGSVLATDLDATALRDLARPNLDVRAHDVLTDELPASRFDLIHLRLVLAWLADPAEALQRLIAALRPGGWLVDEELDFVSSVPDPRTPGASFERVVRAHGAALAQRSGFHSAYGRRVAGDFEEAGLVECGCEGRVSMWRGGQAGGRIWALTLVQLREPMIATGLADADDIDAVLELCGNPGMSVMSPVLMSVWGRR
ncbi:MAG TPA: methyltransferase, partial [Solirubrobacteraceae bacterium]